MLSNKGKRQGGGGGGRRELAELDPLEWLLELPLQGARWDLKQSGADTFVPRIDIRENKDKILVDVELAGIPKDKVDIDLSDDGLLTISGRNEVQKEEEDADKKWHRMERSYGFFKRQIQLPRGVEQSQVQATYKDGLLTVAVPKPPLPDKKTSKIAIRDEAESGQRLGQQGAQEPKKKDIKVKKERKGQKDVLGQDDTSKEEFATKDVLGQEDKQLGSKDVLGQEDKQLGSKDVLGQEDLKGVSGQQDLQQEELLEGQG